MKTGRYVDMYDSGDHTVYELVEVIIFRGMPLLHYEGNSYLMPLTESRMKRLHPVEEGHVPNTPQENHGDVERPVPRNDRPNGDNDAGAV